MIDTYSVAGKLVKRGSAPIEVPDTKLDNRARDLAARNLIKVVPSSRKGHVLVSVP